MLQEERHPRKKAVPRKYKHPVNTVEEKEKCHFSGWMFKEGGSVKSWKKRFVVIWDSYIEYMEAEDSKKPKGVICTFSFLAFVAAQALIGFHFCFNLRHCRQNLSSFPERQEALSRPAVH